MRSARNYLVKRLNSIDGVSCITPTGAFYVMMNIEKLIGRTLGGKLIENDDDFGVAFLEKGLVAVVPLLRLRHKELRPLDLRHLDGEHQGGPRQDGKVPRRVVKTARPA